jgi:hypothetical protein
MSDMQARIEALRVKVDGFKTMLTIPAVSEVKGAVLELVDIVAGLVKEVESLKHGK